MPYYLHQWAYHDQKLRKIFFERQDREQIVRDVAESFEGEVLQFYFCFGDYDGIAISKFPDNERAMACILVLLGEGAVRKLRTTPLIEVSEAMRAMERAHTEVQP